MEELALVALGLLTQEAASTLGVHVGEAASSMAGQIVDRLRDRFRGTSDEVGVEALDRLLDGSADPEVAEIMAERLSELFDGDPDLAAALRMAVDRGQVAGGHIAVGDNAVVGKAQVFGTVNTSVFNA